MITRVLVGGGIALLYIFRGTHQTALPNELSVRLPFWEIGRFQRHRLEPWSSQTNYLEIYICHSIHSQVLCIIRIGLGLVDSVLR